MLMIPYCMQSACQILLNGSFNNEVFDLLEFLRRTGFKSPGIMENKTRIHGESDLILNVVDPTLGDPPCSFKSIIQRSEMFWLTILVGSTPASLGSI